MLPSTRAVSPLIFQARPGAGSGDSINDIVVDDHDDVWLSSYASNGYVLYESSPSDRANKSYFTPKLWPISDSLGLAISPP